MTISQASGTRPDTRTVHIEDFLTHLTVPTQHKSMIDALPHTTGSSTIRGVRLALRNTGGLVRLSFDQILRDNGLAVFSEEPPQWSHDVSTRDIRHLPGPRGTGAAAGEALRNAGVITVGELLGYDEYPAHLAGAVDSACGEGTFAKVMGYLGQVANLPSLIPSGSPRPYAALGGLV